MTRVIRPVWLAVSAASVLFLCAFSTAVIQGVAQSSSSAPTAAQIAPFLGDWVVTATMGANQMTSTLSVKNDGGKPTATITPEGQSAVPITGIVASGSSLVVRYTLDFGGSPIQTVMTLTREAAAGAAGPLRVQMSIMDGQYEMSGMAAKQLPGAPGPQRGA